jgi:prepilin-type N-terminal cleavage/methylation domain-containing protein
MIGMTRKNCKNGFTVGELLIVVAIIAALVGIAIPVITKKVEKAREAYDIYTMRQAASAAIDLYYAGVTNRASALAAGMTWWGNEGDPVSNAAAAYNPQTGTFKGDRKDLPANVKTYGKGTTLNGGTTYVMGNSKGAYAANQDYTHACVLVSIYPYANPAYVDVYWKNNTTSNSTYVGGQLKTNVPNYSIRIYLE